MIDDELACQPKSTTSRDAAESAGARSRAQRRSVYDDLRENGAATSEEIATRMGLRYDSVKARVFELRELELAQSIGTAATGTRHAAQVWAPIVRDDADALLSRRRVRQRGRVAILRDAMTSATSDLVSALDRNDIPFAVRAKILRVLETIASALTATSRK